MFQNKKHKAYLVERIARRKKILGYLRQIDYDRYEWMLNELKVANEPRDPYKIFEKKSARVKEITEIRKNLRRTIQKKIKTVKQDLRSQEEDYFKEKEQILQDIDKDIEILGLNKDEIIANYEKKMIEKATADMPKNKRRFNKAAWRKLEKYMEDEYERTKRDKFVI